MSEPRFVYGATGRVFSLAPARPGTDPALRQAALSVRGVVDLLLGHGPPGTVVLVVRLRWWRKLPGLRWLALRNVRHALEPQRPAGITYEVSS